MRPITIVSTPVQKRSAYGSMSVKGSAPRIEIQIIGRRPIRSEMWPPTSVPVATEAMKTKSCTCAACTGMWKRSIR